MEAYTSAFGCCLSGAIAALSLLSTFPVHAQLIPDQSLGAEHSIINFINENRQDITGGALRGSNLFHSFQEFNIGQAQSVYFANPAAVENILTRVTGTNISKILGTLGVSGDANLFLLNPNGIYFGKDARLDVHGSFTASTSDRITLDENTWFTLTTPAEQLLTIQPETSFNYALQNYLGNITTEGQLQTGNDLNLQGKNLFISGQIGTQGNLNLQGTDTIQIRDSVDNPLQLIAGKNSLIEGLKSVDIFALKHPHSCLWSAGDMTLKSANDVGGDAHFFSGGNFKIESLDNTLGNLYSPYDPIIRSYGDINFNIYEGSSLHILAGGSVKIGTVVVDYPEYDYFQENGLNFDFIRENIELSDHSTLIIDGSLQPILDIRAGVSTEFIGIPNITGMINGIDGFYLGSPPNTSNINPLRADITIGDIWINAPDGMVLLTNQYHPNQLEGDIIIDPKIGFWGSGIWTQNDYGNSSDVFIDSRNNINSFDIFTNAFFEGDSGDIWLSAQSNIYLNDVDVTSSNYENPNGIAGNISISGFNIFGNSVGLKSLSHGITSGNINLIATGDIILDNASSIFSGNSWNALGGKITIYANNFELKNGSAIQSPTFGSKEAGAIDIDVAENLVMTGSYLNKFDYFDYFSGSLIQSSSVGLGDAGNIDIRAKNLYIEDGGRILSSSLNSISGSGGNIDIYLSGNLVVKGSTPDFLTESQISSTTLSTQRSGNITISANSLFVQDGAFVSSETLNSGNAGLIYIYATDLVQVSGFQPRKIWPSYIGVPSETNDKSRIAGSSGSIEIETSRLILENGGLITASTWGLGFGGEISIHASDSIILSKDDSLLGGEITTKNRGYGTMSAGDIFIETSTLTLNEKGSINSDTFGLGNAGNIEINSFNLGVFQGSQISSTTSSLGKAGNIKLTVDNDIILDGINTGIFASTSPTSQGNGGSINIDPVNTIIRNGAGISVDSQGTGIGGDIFLISDRLTLENNGFISAKSLSTTGGNIELILAEYLLFEDNSSITTFAGSQTATANAGNITITAPFIIALPDQDNNIIAEAFGTGGKIQINATGIYGIQFTGQHIPVRNDISAASLDKFGTDGTVTIDIPELDPTSGLHKLPENLVDADDLIARNACLIEHQQIAGGSSLVVVGKGGLVASPTGNLTVRTATVDFINTPPTTDTTAIISDSTEQESHQPEIELIQGWWRSPEGKIHLASKADHPNATIPTLQHPNCQ